MKNGPYTLVVAPVDYPGKKYRGKYAYEHHVVYWKKFKKVPKKDECIHHINHNQRDNRIKNLKLIKTKTHCSLHVEPAPHISLSCFKCEKLFEKQLKDYRFRTTKLNQKRFFCSRSCLVSTTSKERWEKFRSGRRSVHPSDCYSEGPGAVPGTGANLIRRSK